MAGAVTGAVPPAGRHHEGESIFHTLSHQLTLQSRIFAERIPTRDTDDETSEDEPISNPEEWKLMPEIKGIQDQAEKDDLKGRRLGVTWTNLTVKGVGADAAFNENVGSQFNIPQLIREKMHGSPLKTILENSHGCVKPGEMLLVLGRPGAGCTTLLKMLSNRRSGYAQVDGDVFYGSMTSDEVKQYRGQLVMNTEEELFFPTLTVGQTIDFATRMKVPFKIPSNHETPSDFQQQSRDFLLRSMGIAHTHETKVGNEYVRGVSGGERKRVSIIECLATRGSVFCWDNSTRGLDASTALEYTRAVRAITDIFGIASIVTLYQAGNGIYNLFDKVLVLEEGKQIYYGPMRQARPFMEGLGFVCEDSANVADFLTGATVPTERRIKDGFEGRFPRTAEDIRLAYEKTSIRADMEREYDYPTTQQAKERTLDFKHSVQYEKHNSLPKKSPLTTSFLAQVKACVVSLHTHMHQMQFLSRR
jgi:ATP-binding cassette subfamily G (WHITE) protein 2 (SNQ2)